MYFMISGWDHPGSSVWVLTLMASVLVRDRRGDDAERRGGGMRGQRQPWETNTGAYRARHGQGCSERPQTPFLGCIHSLHTRAPPQHEAGSLFPEIWCSPVPGSTGTSSNPTHREVTLQPLEAMSLTLVRVRVGRARPLNEEVNRSCLGEEFERTAVGRGERDWGS